MGWSNTVYDPHGVVRIQNMTFVLTDHDLEKLKTVHPDLQKVIYRATEYLPHDGIKDEDSLTFGISYGLRTQKEQYDLWRQSHDLDGMPNGMPWKTNFNGYDKGKLTPYGAMGTGVSRHQTKHAIDLFARVGGDLTWTPQYYPLLADVIKRCAADLKVSVIWGGDFTKKKDMPHFELNERFYP